LASTPSGGPEDNTSFTKEKTANKTTTNGTTQTSVELSAESDTSDSR